MESKGGSHLTLRKKRRKLKVNLKKKRKRKREAVNKKKRKKRIMNKRKHYFYPYLTPN